MDGSTSEVRGRTGLADEVSIDRDCVPTSQPQSDRSRPAISQTCRFGESKRLEPFGSRGGRNHPRSDIPAVIRRGGVDGLSMSAAAASEGEDGE